MDQSTIKTNFVGRDGFIWWVGQIPKIDSWKDQANGSGWGTRYKVRIMGYHPASEVELKDDDLPWAPVSTFGYTGSGNSYKTIRYNQGDNVWGFFFDGKAAQMPFIVGGFGNTAYSKKDSDTRPFGNLTGYSELNKKPAKGSLCPDETGDQNAASQKSPRTVGPKDGKKIDPECQAVVRTSDGKTVSLPCGDQGEENKGSKKVINKIKNALQQFVEFIQDLKAQFDEKIEYYRDWIKKEIDTRAEQITNIASGLIAGMVTSVFQKLIPILGKGLDMLYEQVFGVTLAATANPAAAHLAGVAAQTAMVPPVKRLQDLIECLTNQIISKFTGVVADILKSIADNVLNFAQCIADQSVGAMINSIISIINDGMLPAIEGVAKILQFFEDFSVEGLLRNGIDALLGLVGLKTCNKKEQKDKYGACKYKLGYGPIFQDDLDLKGIIDNANTAKAISEAAKVAGFPLDAVQDLVGSFDFFSNKVQNPDFIGDLGSCYCGPPVVCGPPKINIFGGGGTGASAVPILGAIVGEDKYKTGSIISVKVTNPGSGYTFPPFVEVVDSCDQGYGGVARATIKDGKIDTIYVVSEGENYPVDEVIPYIVESVSVINPGQDYENGDRVVDNQGNEYDVVVQSGAIIKVTPINSKDVTNIPVLEVISKNGSGAILAANLGERPPFDGEVKQVIDCIT